MQKPELSDLLKNLIIYGICDYKSQYLTTKIDSSSNEYYNYKGTTEYINSDKNEPLKAYISGFINGFLYRSISSTDQRFEVIKTIPETYKVIAPETKSFYELGFNSKILSQIILAKKE